MECCWLAHGNSLFLQKRNIETVINFFIGLTSFWTQLCSLNRFYWKIFSWWSVCTVWVFTRLVKTWWIRTTFGWCWNSEPWVLWFTEPRDAGSRKNECNGGSGGSQHPGRQGGGHGWRQTPVPTLRESIHGAEQPPPSLENSHRLQALSVPSLLIPV